MNGCGTPVLLFIYTLALFYLNPDYTQRWPFCLLDYNTTGYTINPCNIGYPITTKYRKKGKSKRRNLLI